MFEKRNQIYAIHAEFNVKQISMYCAMNIEQQQKEALKMSRLFNTVLPCLGSVDLAKSNVFGVVSYLLNEI